MKIEDINQLKEFILWAKAENVQAVKIGEVEFTFNGLAFMNQGQEYDPPSNPRLDSDTLSENHPPPKPDFKVNGEDIDDETLFWSAE